MNTHQGNGVFSLRKERGEMDSEGVVLAGARTGDRDIGYKIGNTVDGGFNTSPCRTQVSQPCQALIRPYHSSRHTSQRSIPNNPLLATSIRT